MRFYAFNEDGGDTVNLLLDHNTTANLDWNLSGSNTSGPKEVLEKLQTDTSSWVGTETLANYTMDQTGQTSNAKYTIDYTSYKARLITANEVAEIVGNTSWNEKTASDKLYFDANTWLYNKTYPDCYGYWTVSSKADSSSDAWFVHYGTYIGNVPVSNSYFWGVRTVIEVLRSKLS